MYTPVGTARIYDHKAQYRVPVWKSRTFLLHGTAATAALYNTCDSNTANLLATDGADA